MESKIFGIIDFGELSNLLINVLAACVNNPFALLNVAVCTDCAALALKKEASYISSLVDPLVQKLGKEIDGNGAPHNSIVDLVGLDISLQNTSSSLLDMVPSMLSLFFSLMFSDALKNISCSPTSTKLVATSGEEYVIHPQLFSRSTAGDTMDFGFIKPSECRMAGEHIALLRLLHLKDALKSMVITAEFLALNNFKSVAAVIGNNNFWKYLLVMCQALNTPMHVLHLANQKTPAVDKLNYYVLQADCLLLHYFTEAEELSHAVLFLIQY